MKKIWLKFILINLSALILFLVDRAIKIYFFKNPAQKIGGDFLNIHLEKNFGLAFGFDFLHPVILLILIISLIFVLFGFLISAYQKKWFLGIFGFSLIIFGAVSNLIDRLNYGFVIDYFDLSWFTVFNLADTMISFGVAIIATAVLFDKKKTNP